MDGESVKLLGFWASPYSLRVKWALKLKGIEYEYVEEDLKNKSQLLLECNPVYKKIPVLVHEGKPLAESLVIIEYIDETWKRNPVLPHDPHERAIARFWVKFADDKCVPAMQGAFSKQGEEREKGLKEARENLKILESFLGEKSFFGGERIGFVDIAVGWMGLWGRLAEEVAGVNILDAETMPRLNAWFQSFVEIPIIKESIPPWDKLLEHTKDVHKKILTAGST